MLGVLGWITKIHGYHELQSQRASTLARAKVIDHLAKLSFELLFTQVKIVMDKMFSIILLSRFIHLEGNLGSKVWSKWTTKTTYP